MKKFTITVISLFIVLLIPLSAAGEAMGTPGHSSAWRTHTYKYNRLI